MKIYDENRLTFSGIFGAFFIFILPYVTSEGLFYGSVNAKYFFILALVYVFLIIFFWNVFSKKITLSLKQRWFLCSLVLLLGVHYLSAFAGLYPMRSLWSDIIRGSGVFFLSHIAVLAFCLGELLNARDWTVVRRSIAVSSGFFAFLTLIGPDGLGIFSSFLTMNLSVQGLTLGSGTFAGAYLLLGVIITIIEFTRSEKKSKARWFLGAMLLMEVCSTLFIEWGNLFNGAAFSNSFSLVGNARASAVTLFLVILYLGGMALIRLFRNSTLKKPLIRIWSGIWIVGIVALIGTLFYSGSVVQNEYIKLSGESRIVVWNMAFDAIKERPLLGWGPENYVFAHQKYFDNRLLGEIWFDRAHNVIIDTFVSIGLVGLLIIIGVLLFFLRVLLQATRQNIIQKEESCLLAVLVFAHIIQLQTSFDTIATYGLLGVIAGYGLWLEKEIIKSRNKGEESAKATSFNILSKVAASVFLILAIISLKYLLINEFVRQRALMKIFSTLDQQKQIEYINKAVERQSNFESLRLSSASLIKGGLQGIASSGGDPGNAKNFSAQLTLYEEYFKKYLNEMPADYRARMNYAYLLILKTTLGENRLLNAKKVISDSYELSPKNPITYGLDAVVELYSGNIKLAKEKANQMILLNPDFKFSREILAYIEKQEKQFPVISVIKLENL